MNQGEENRFDGTLKSKFDNFEQMPSHSVWDSLSGKLPSKAPKTGFKGIVPFMAGIALGMATMFGAGTTYLHFADGGGAAGTIFTGAGNQQTGNPGTQQNGNAANAQSGFTAEENQALTASNMGLTASTQVLPMRPVLIKSPEIKFIAQPARFSAEPSPETFSIASKTKASPISKQNTENLSPNNVQETGTSAAAARNNTAGQTALQNSETGIAASPAQLPAAAGGATVAPSGKILNIESAWLVGLELDTSITQELKILGPEANKSEQVHNMLKAQATVLALLQNRNDSLLFALQTETDSLAEKARIARHPVARSGGSVRPPAWPFPSKWAMALIVETTPGWGNIQHGESYTSAKENNLRSLSQQVRLQHRINSRLSVSAGIGITQLHSSLKYFQNTRVPGETILIDGVPTQTIELRNIDQTLRPTYNFITVPVALHQKVAGRGRLSIGLSAGTQVTVFNKGNKPVWNNHRYQLEKISTGEGPFRPASVAMHGSLDLSLRVSPKANLMVSPTLRWWALTPFKDAKTSYNMVPGLQVGMGWDL